MLIQLGRKSWTDQNKQQQQQYPDYVEFIRPKEVDKLNYVDSIRAKELGKRNDVGFNRARDERSGQTYVDYIRRKFRTNETLGC